jgi:hypothetical protein
MENLTAAMTTTSAQFLEQSQGLVRIETQFEAIEERITEVRRTLYGSDGDGGIMRKITAAEASLGSIKEDISDLRAMAGDFKKTIVKIVIMVIGSGALSGGAAAKFLAAIQ